MKNVLFTLKDESVRSWIGFSCLSHIYRSLYCAPTDHINIIAQKRKNLLWTKISRPRTLIEICPTQLEYYLSTHTFCIGSFCSNESCLKRVVQACPGVLCIDGQAWTEFDCVWIKKIMSSQINCAKSQRFLLSGSTEWAKKLTRCRLRHKQTRSIPRTFIGTSW